MAGPDEDSQGIRFLILRPYSDSRVMLGVWAAQLPVLGVQLQPPGSVNPTAVAAISCLPLAPCQSRQTLACCCLPGLCMGQEAFPFTE